MSTRWMVRLLAVSALLTGCGASGEGATPPPRPAGATTAPSVAPSPVDPDAAETMTIAEVLRRDGRFSTWHDLAQRARTRVAPSWLDVWDWEATRMGDDREGVTVFVPTDAAFEQLDPAVLAVLDDPDIEDDLLYSLMGHHYVHRLYPSSAFRPGPQRTWGRSLDGPIELGVDPLTWDGQPIVQTDLRTANGYIHVISGVVVPDTLAAAAAG